MTDLDESWERLEAWLTTHAPEMAENLASGASEEALQEAAQTLGGAFAGEARAWFARHDGEVEDLECVFGDWMLPLERALGERETLLSVHSGDNAWRPTWLPICSDSAGNFRYVDLESGQLRDFDHEGWVHAHVADSLGRFLEVVAATFEEKNPQPDEDCGWVYEDEEGEEIEWTPFDEFKKAALDPSDL